MDMTSGAGIGNGYTKRQSQAYDCDNLWQRRAANTLEMVRVSDISCEADETMRNTQPCAHRQKVDGWPTPFRQLLDDGDYKSSVKFGIKTGCSELGDECSVLGLMRPGLVRNGAGSLWPFRARRARS